MTAEEKAMEYTDNEFAILPKSMAKEDMRHRAQKDFEAGYNEAMRWRDPKEEPPEDVGLYQCKCESRGIGFYFEIVFFNKVWRSDRVIGWRPIE